MHIAKLDLTLWQLWQLQVSHALTILQLRKQPFHLRCSVDQLLIDLLLRFQRNILFRTRLC
jgi:hypothetical protein